MITKFDTNDKVWIMASVKNAMKVNDKIYYGIKESDYVVPEYLCKKCTDEEISALEEARSNYHRAILGDSPGLSYSSQDSLF